MIGIITAMDSEAAAIRSVMHVESTTETAGIVFWTGTIEGEDVTLALGGVGKAMAAMAATLLIELCDPDYILNAGVAGGLRDTQKVTDLVISSRIIQGDYDTSPLDGPEGFGKVFDPDIRLVNRARQILDELQLPSELGEVVSQDKFVARPEDVAFIRSHWPGTACAEMEAGAIAQVAHAFRVPFLAVRALSDVTGHDDNPMEFEKFTEVAAENTARFIRTWCACL